ncbi:hypothetical protein [Streptomyces sp. NPDC048636]|uniref:hypothetical protein n=1 Tax=Streptomyces sp. NPDC048636 TaxID=3155762 RepID=UPI003428896E
MERNDINVFEDETNFRRWTGHRAHILRSDLTELDRRIADLTAVVKSINLDGDHKWDQALRTWRLVRHLKEVRKNTASSLESIQRLHPAYVHETVEVPRRRLEAAKKKDERRARKEERKTIAAGQRRAAIAAAVARKGEELEIPDQDEAKDGKSPRTLADFVRTEKGR